MNPILQINQEALTGLLYYFTFVGATTQIMFLLPRLVQQEIEVIKARRRITALRLSFLQRRFDVPRSWEVG